MIKDLISVIIPVYNAEEYIERCLKSVLNNSYKNIEVIVIDDGSSDYSADIVASLASNDVRIKLILQSNSGTAVARNVGIKEAKGEFIAFVDDDDFIHKDFYKIMHRAIKKNDADIVVCELTRDMQSSQFNNQILREIDNNTIVDKKSFIKDTYISNWTRNTVPWNKLYKRKLFDNICFPLGKGYEDAFTIYKLLFAAEKIAYVNHILYYWYRNEESYSSKSSNPQKLFFREEAIREQTMFYPEDEYADVILNARYFYLTQVFFMYYQLRHDYEQNRETWQCIKKMRRMCKIVFRKNHKLCKDNLEKIRYFEELYPVLGGLIRSRFLRR